MPACLNLLLLTSLLFRILKLEVVGRVINIEIWRVKVALSYVLFLSAYIVELIIGVCVQRVSKAEMPRTSDDRTEFEMEYWCSPCDSRDLSSRISLKSS
jgi:hypothetical protein